MEVLLKCSVAGQRPATGERHRAGLRDGPRRRDHAEEPAAGRRPAGTDGKRTRSRSI